jgi:hypothetical protein
MFAMVGHHTCRSESLAELLPRAKIAAVKVAVIRCYCMSVIANPSPEHSVIHFYWDILGIKSVVSD